MEGSNKYLFGKYSESSLVLEVSELELVQLVERLFYRIVLVGLKVF